MKPRAKKHATIQTFGRQWWEWTHAISMAVGAMDDAALGKLQVACESYIETNCWFADYHAAREILRARSEERRVGKECRSRWSPYH